MYELASQPTAFDKAESQVRALLKTNPRMPATVIAERIGWRHSVRLLSGHVLG